MVDTVRSLSALQTLLADNTSGDISAQDVRDFLVSVFPPQFSGASVYSSSAITFAHNTIVSLPFNQEVYDTDNYHDTATNNTRLTAPFDGYYLVTANVVLNADPDGDWGGVTCWFRVDGTTETTVFAFQPSAATAANQGTMLTDTIYMDAGSYVEYRVRQTNGDSDSHTSINNNQASPYFRIAYLGQAPA